MSLVPRVVQFKYPTSIKGMGSLMQVHRAQCDITVDRKLRCAWVSCRSEPSGVSQEVPMENIKCIEWVEGEE